jgi:hypothetical protein
LQSDQIKRRISHGAVEISARMQANSESLQDFIQAQSISDRHALLQGIRNELHRLLLPVAPDQVRLGSALDAGDSAFQIDVQRRTASLHLSRSFAPSDSGFERLKSSSKHLGNIRCQCKRGRTTKIWNLGRFGFKMENQNPRYCPIHGYKQSWGYSVEAKLSPWLNKTLELTLGVLNNRNGWSMMPPLKYHGYVKRAG